MSFISEKMIRNLFIIFIVVTIYSCKNSQRPVELKLESSESVMKRVSALFQIEMKQNYVLSKEDEKRFFLALPNNFDEFISFYGTKYQLKDGRKLFLSCSYHYNILLPNLFYIDDKLITEKLIRISLGGHYVQEKQISSMDLDSISSLSNLLDATAEFQRNIQLYFASNVVISCQILKELSNIEILSFWRFYFDGPHPKNYHKDFEELQRRYKEHDLRIANLMKDSYEKLLLNHDDHGY